MKLTQSTDLQWDEILHWCIFNSEKRTAKSAAEYIGISAQQFGMWRNYQKSGNFPTEDQIVKIAELCDIQPCVAWLSMQRVKIENPVLKSSVRALITIQAV